MAVVGDPVEVALRGLLYGRVDRSTHRRMDLGGHRAPVSRCLHAEGLWIVGALLGKLQDVTLRVSDGLGRVLGNLQVVERLALDTEPGALVGELRREDAPVVPDDDLLRSTLGVDVVRVDLHQTPRRWGFRQAGLFLVDGPGINLALDFRPKRRKGPADTTGCSAGASNHPGNAEPCLTLPAHLCCRASAELGGPAVEIDLYLSAFQWHQKLMFPSP